MRSSALQIESLTKTYDDVIALDGVSLVVEPGEVVGLLGPNGAGKTTLVSIVLGLRRPDSGTVDVMGVDAVAHPGKARRHIGFAPQDLGIYPIDTVRQNLSLFGELSGLRGAGLAAGIDEVAEALRLSDLMDRKAAELSGGQKRRLHTAIALLNRPDLILLDEATTGADVETRSALIGVVKGLAAGGSAVVYSTHYLGEVEALDARVVILDHGRVLADGSVGGLISRNGGAFVELVFTGHPPIVQGRWDVTVDGNTVRVAVDDPGQALGPLFDSLGSGTKKLENVTLVTPSLETVFMSLTGRRYESEEESDVMAS
ncbi:MAG TPA: ABC transporter ATP-binding protein [Acidimicrobiia bacterium]|jgi:ABC-2 type transport system ATP-binding protein|nr:ABC transporter ATP-binding protein [Acidimicrobiia bacterium]